MFEFHDNLFNLRQDRNQRKLKLWRYAGLMLTYRCTAACRFCYYYCCPQAGGLMSTETAIGAWEGLVRIAGDSAHIHITGGEPFLYFERLAEILHQAQRQGLGGMDSVETNAEWGESEKDIAEKLKLLDSLGMERLKISWDPFHEEFVEVASVRRLTQIAQQILGAERVLVRWQQYLDHPSGIRKKSEQDKKLILQNALRSEPCRFTGRAADVQGPLAAKHPCDYFQSRSCRNALLSAKGVHIDPYGNVFNGQCSGMVIGNITQTPLDTLWKTWQPDRDDFWKTLYHDGPFGFIEEACRSGYVPQEKYASKCHLCTDIRRFFFDKRHYFPIIAPKECYGVY